MKKIFSLAIWIVAALCLFSSCFNDDDSGYTLYHDSAITAFTLGKLKMEGHATSSKGEDSLYWTDIDCSGYTFYIDHLKGQIYNPDSLLYGIDASRILCTATAKNNGIVLLKSLESDSVDYLSSEDSLDFTRPRTLRVVSYTGLGSRDYTVTVNVHRQKADEFIWRKSTASTLLAGMQAMRGLALGDYVYVVGRDADGARVCRASIYDARQWSELTTSPTLDADAYRNMAVMGGKVYVYSGGNVMVSADGMATWTTLSARSFDKLLGASDHRLYALGTDQTIYSSEDGTVWEAETIDQSADLLPREDVTLLYRPLITNKDANRLTLAGTSDSGARLWTKIEENDDRAETQPWVYNKVSGNVQHDTPNLTNLQMVSYDGKLLAMGGRGKGNWSGTKAFDRFYTSIDGGLSWSADTLYDVPEGFASSPTSFTLVRDANQFLWMICGESGQVWRGRVNRLGWREDQKYFEE